MPFASPASLTPITATNSRPATSPSSRPEKLRTTATFRAARSDSTLSKLFCEASDATSAIFSFPRFAASRTCCTPTTASRPRSPSPTSPRTFRLAASLILPFSFLFQKREPRLHPNWSLPHRSRSSRRPHRHRLRLCQGPPAQRCLPAPLPAPQPDRHRSLNPLQW